MKGNKLVFYFMMFACTSVYGTEVLVSSPEQLSLVGIGDDVIINNGGVYSLNNLDSINAGGITIDFNLAGGGSNPLMVLNVDSGFDGILAAPLVNNLDNLQIKLMDDFLADISGNEVLRFNNFTTMGGFINVVPENTSGTYVYYWGLCSDGTGWCIMREDSATYNAARQSALRAERIAAIGVQNNPKMLLRPMITVHQHELLRYYDFSDEFFISISPEYYNAKNFHNIGVRLNSGTKIGGRLYVGASAYAIKSNFENDVSEFDSDVYGGNLRFNYYIDDVLFLRGIGGFGFSSTDCDGVKKGGSSVNDPTAYGLYGGLDFGAKFDFESGLYLSPSVGYDMRSERVVDVHQTDSFVHLGNDIGFKYFMDGMSYDYILRTGLDLRGYLDAEVGIGVWTVADKIGGTVSFGVLDTDFGWTCKASANIKIAF